MDLEKADGTAKYANHAEPEWIGIHDGFTQRGNGFVRSILFPFAYLAYISRFELPFSG